MRLSIGFIFLEDKSVRIAGLQVQNPKFPKFLKPPLLATTCRFPPAGTLLLLPRYRIFRRMKVKSVIFSIEWLHLFAGQFSQDSLRGRGGGHRGRRTTPSSLSFDTLLLLHLIVQDFSSWSEQRHHEGFPPVLLFTFQTHMLAQIPTGFHGCLAPPSHFLTQCDLRAASGNSFSGLSRTPPSSDRDGGELRAHVRAPCCD